MKRETEKGFVHPILQDTDSGAYSRGVCDFIQKNFPRALKELGRCLELNPRHVKALKLRAHIHNLNGDVLLAHTDSKIAAEIEREEKPDG